MPLTEDEHPVGDLGPGGEHEPFRLSVRPRAAGRNLHDLDAGIGQDRVKRRGELTGPITILVPLAWKSASNEAVKFDSRSWAERQPARDVAGQRPWHGFGTPQSCGLLPCPVTGKKRRQPRAVRPLPDYRITTSQSGADT
jgi:hypothetical protein